jgi:hypothetical protein
MKVTAWSNGKENPNGNGISLSPSDRDMFINRAWKSVIIELGDSGSVIRVNIDKDSLWTGNCPHLISVEIGKWLHENHLSPWENREPPKLYFIYIRGNTFQLRTIKGAL